MSRDALVVGINTYTHLPGLKAPAADAEAIARRLEKDGDFRVWRLPEIVQAGRPVVGNLHPSRWQNSKKLWSNCSTLEAINSRTALFYVSGHGLRQQVGVAERPDPAAVGCPDGPSDWSSLGRP